MSLCEYLRVNKYKIFKTILTYLTFAGLGGTNTLIGSSLLDIQIYVQRSFEATSRLVQTRSVGYVVGATVAGFFEKYFDDSLVLSASNLVAGVFLALAPWFRSLETVLVFIFIAGFALGVFDIYCNVIILRIWGKNGVNWLQVLHMFYGVGALIVPIITRPFLLPSTESDGLNTDQGVSITSPETIDLTNATAIINAINKTTTITYTPEDVKVQYAFMVVGMVLVVVAVPYFFCYLYDRKQKFKVEETGGENSRFVQTSRLKKVLAVTITAALANFAFGTEAVVGNLCTAFAVKADVHMDKQNAVLVATVFWTMFSFYRCIFIPLTLVIKESKLFYMNLLIIVAGVVTLVPYAASKELFTWISFTLLGIGYSPVFSISYGSLGHYFPVTNAMTSFIFVNGVIGETIHTTVLSKVIETNPVVFTYYLGVMGIIYVMLSFLLPLYCRKVFKGSKKKNVVNESNEMCKY
ncbi:major facilitator superfamily domain-containing protein 4A [Tetranychus urticae]|uniref:Major facilitator superfamily (MFS) profile domain-containing protein n=1 Tax=Tetranychus urticae TaxID=32264 RepID=T1KM38_TETUR|nr:major facilitator superfamily domain-containing protein 4A [Tetranychus urticae]